MYQIVIVFFRIGSYLRKLKIPLIPFLLDYFNRIIFGIWLPSTAKIGKGIVLGYGGLGIVIHNRAVLGENCHVDQGVTIGGTSKKYGVPQLGDNIYVGAGAKIIGPIKIGHNVVIGANAVVVKDIPSNSLVVGVPGKIIKRDIIKSDYV